MAGTNQTGRTTKKEQFILLHRGVTKSKAWKNLTCEARCLLLEIWQRHTGQNNGSITFSHREARIALSIGALKVAKAFHALQDCGFLICRTKGSFDCKVRHATEWEVTTESCDNKPATKLYKKWPEIHFTVTTVVTNGDYSSDREPQNQGVHGDYRRYTYNIPREGETSP